MTRAGSAATRQVDRRLARRSRAGFGPRALLGAMSLVLALGLIVAPAAISAPAPFAKFCTEGSGAGNCIIPRGVATSPVDGHIFVADSNNARVNEFTAWGAFVKSWGWGVDDGSAELQVCSEESTCQAGIPGAGVGQLKAPMGVAVDSAGNVYVAEFEGYRVSKFDPDGNFLLMFGGGVNQGPNNPGNVCTAAHVAAGDTCGAGTTGTANGQFSSNWGIGSYIAVGPGDEVFVGDENRIQVFSSGGVYQRQLPIPQPGSVGSLTVDPLSGDVYMAYPNGRLESEKTLPDVYRLDEATGAVLDTLAVEKPAALAVDEAGSVYVFDQRLIVSGSPSDPGSHGTRILKFDSAGNPVEVIAQTPIFGEEGEEEIRNSTGLATGSFCFKEGERGLYVASFAFTGQAFDLFDYVQAYGPTPDPAKCAPPDVAPDIDGEFAASVDNDSADVRAEINPHYFTGTVGTTTYRVQWGTAQCIEEEGFEGACATEQPLPPAMLDSPPVDKDVTTGPILLEGLSPETTYAYRFVVERERAAGSDPAVWVATGTGAEFTTLPEGGGPIGTCPNDAFRTGPGANLRDCRAYELVTPIDKGGGDVKSLLNLVPFETRVDQASLSGDELTFSAYRAFEDPASAPFSSQYLTRRTAGGWETEAISAPQKGEAFFSPLFALDNLYRAFSPDLKQAWLYSFTEPVLGTGGQAGLPNVYRRDNASGAYEACSTAVPLTSLAGTHSYQLQGFSADGEVAAFRIEAKLTPNGSDALKVGGARRYQAYVCAFDESGNATVRLVSVLPDGEASDLENTIGGPGNEIFQTTQGRTESLDNAISADGSKVFWTASADNDADSPGALYLRLNADREETASGQCEGSEPDKACTVLISAGPKARFWTAADDGSVAIFSEEAGPNKGDLNEYIVASGETLPIAEEVLGILGSSEDASRIYFLSAEEIGGEGSAGEPNLYLYDKGAGTTTYLATLSELDARQGKGVPTPGNYEPAWHTARVTPDGSAVAFMSNDPELAEEVAGYDNTDQNSGLPAAEIYRYEAGGELVCVSCNRTGARPQGREIQDKTFSNIPHLYAASMLPTWLNALYAPRVLSSDGQRVFFESFEALSPADTNGKADVYQWEALDKGTCTEADSAFDPQSEGCVSLLSSGKATADAQFVDASPTGEDVFIRTSSSLVGWDPEAIDIYDARVLGGFPAPPIPPEECRGEAECKPPAPAAPATPALETLRSGPGNVHAKTPTRRHCRKGTHKVKRKGKVRCVKNKKAGKAGKSGRAGR